MKRKTWIKIMYIFMDIVIAFVFGIFTFRYSGIASFSDLTNNQLIGMFVYSGSIALMHVIGFLIFNVYNILSRNFSIYDALKVSIISIVIHFIGLIAILVVPNKFLYFRWQELISWAISTAIVSILMVAERFFPRLFAMAERRIHSPKTIRTLIIGAGSAAKIVVDDARYNKDNKHNIVVIVDDDENKIGGVFSGIPVKGPISEINKIIDFYQIEEVIIAIVNLDDEKFHNILDLLSSSNVRVKRMPLLSEMSGPNDTRIIDVNLDDLLCREPIKLDNHEVKGMLHNKIVLVTGAGGSIGSELVRQIFKTKPSILILFDIYENSTYDIQQELVRKIRNEKITGITIIALIGSTYNMTRIEQVFKKYKPDYVFHAAAYKHVPLMEDSPVEAIRTNVLGTYNVAYLADKYQVKKMVLVSTDKAVRPTNVMGATKRFAETIIQYFSDKSKNTKYAAVRFGNVLGSNGSVVPLFKKQIEEGGPITITDKKIIRYFMTIPEAVSLILQCGLYATGGEIFILDMGNPVKILNLAERLIRQAGLVPYVDIDIIETGLRPGEKLYEELLLDVKHQQKTANKRIFIEEKERIFPIEEEIKTISKAFELENNEDIKNLLSSIITSYQRENKPNE